MKWIVIKLTETAGNVNILRKNPTMLLYAAAPQMIGYD